MTPALAAPSSPTPIVRALSDGDIDWTFGGAAPWPSSRPVRAVALELLPLLDDALAAQAVEQLLVALVARDEELAAVHVIQRAALAEAHDLHVEVRRLTERLAAAHEALRQMRAA